MGYSRGCLDPRRCLWRGSVDESRKKIIATYSHVKEDLVLAFDYLQELALFEKSEMHSEMDFESPLTSPALKLGIPS